MSDATTIPTDFLDLLQTGTAAFATNSADGLPQVTAIWFLYDGGELKISLNTSRQKYKNLLRDPKATFFIIDPANSQRTLEIRGTVEIAADPDYVEANKVGAKYGGADLKSWDAPGSTRAILTLRPTKVVATKMG